MEQTATDHSIVCGVLMDGSDEQIVLGLPETDYRLHLSADAAVDTPVGTHRRGRIHARARRIDVAPSGGCYIEPVYGQPRRLQGRIVAMDPKTDSITVHCGCPFVCVLSADQKASAFEIGDFVTFDIESGARFEPI